MPATGCLVSRPFQGEPAACSVTPFLHNLGVKNEVPSACPLQKCIPSQFRGQRCKIQLWATSFRRLQGEVLPGYSFWRLLAALAVPCPVPPSPRSRPPSSHDLSPPCMSVCLSSSNKDTGLWTQGPACPCRTSCSQITSAKPLFLRKVTFCGFSGRNLGRTLFNPLSEERSEWSQRQQA